MSNTLQLKDKVTGEVVTLKLKEFTPVKKEISDKPVGIGAINESSDKFNKEIASRGTLGGEIKQNILSPNPVRKGMGVLGVFDAPRRAIEAGIANPALAMQSGNFNPIDLARESVLGFSGKKLGQYGDVMQIAGMPKPVAATAGFVLSASPAKALQMLKRGFGQITKLSDKGITNAGNSLIKSTEEATKFVGKNLDDSYKAVSGAKVDVAKVKDSIKELPKPLKAELEKQFGVKISEVTDLDVGQLRKLKGFVGKYRPSAFGREGLGLKDTLDSEKISRAYGSLKDLIKETVKNTHGEKVANSLLKADEAFTKVSRSSEYIKKSIVDRILQEPTKAGGIAKKMVLEGDTSGRLALNTLRNSGKQARREIDRAVTELEKFNKYIALSEFGKHASNAMIYGGAMGGIGGYAAGKVYRGGSE